MRLTKYIFFILFLIYLTAGCSPNRIVKYTTYEDSELNGKKPAILFADEHFFVVKIDGKTVPEPFWAGLYGGRHIYISPGRHQVSFTHGKRASYFYTNTPTLSLYAKENMYYKLDRGIRGYYIEEMAMPNKLPTTTSNMK